MRVLVRESIADAGVELLRSRFEVSGYGVLHRIGAAAGRVALGIELRFR